MTVDDLAEFIAMCLLSGIAVGMVIAVLLLSFSGGE